MLQVDLKQCDSVFPEPNVSKVSEILQVMYFFLQVHFMTVLDRLFYWLNIAIL